MIRALTVCLLTLLLLLAPGSAFARGGKKKNRNDGSRSSSTSGRQKKSGNTSSRGRSGSTRSGSKDSGSKRSGSKKSGSKKSGSKKSGDRSGSSTSRRRSPAPTPAVQEESSRSRDRRQALVPPSRSTGRSAPAPTPARTAKTPAARSGFRPAARSTAKSSPDRPRTLRPTTLRPVRDSRTSSRPATRPTARPTIRQARPATVDKGAARRSRPAAPAAETTSRRSGSNSSFVRFHADRRPIITVEASQRRAQKLYPRTQRNHRRPVPHSGYRPCIWPGWYHGLWYGWGTSTVVVWPNDEPEVIVIEKEVPVLVEPVEDDFPANAEDEGAPEPIEVPEDDSVPPLDAETEHWLTEGSQAFASKRYADAAEAFRMAVVASPAAAAPKFAFGQALLAMGDWDYAANVLRSALVADPGILTATGSIATVYESTEEFYVVLSRLKTGLAKAPEDADLMFLLVYQYYFSDDPAAVAWFSRLERAAPEDATLPLLRPALPARFPGIR